MCTEELDDRLRGESLIVAVIEEFHAINGGTVAPTSHRLLMLHATLSQALALLGRGPSPF